MKIFKYSTFFVFLAVFVCHPTLAQSDLTRTENDIIVSRNLETNEYIVANIIEFKDKVVQFEINKAQGSATIFLRKTGNASPSYATIIRYNLSNDSILWFKKYPYRYTHFLDRDSILLDINANNTSRINLETGETIWTREGAIFGIQNRFNLSYMYHLDKKYNASDKLNGIKLTNGNQLWERDIPHKFDWNNIEVFNDSIAIITSDGLHAININTGEGWDFEATTGELINTNASVAAFGILGGIIGGAIAGAIINVNSPNGMSAGYSPNLKRNMCSNVLKIDKHLFFSSKYTMAKIDFNTGNVIREKGHPYPSKNAGKSDIFLRGENLIQINLGYADLMDKEVYCFKPYVASIDTATLENNYLTVFKSRKQFVIDYQIVSDEIILLFSNHIAKMNLNNGKKLDEIDLDEAFLNFNNQFKSDVQIANNHYIKKNRGVFQHVSALMNQEIYILVDGKIKYILNPQTLDISEDLLDIEIYKAMELGEYKLAISESGSVLLNESLTPIAELQLSANFKLVGNKLYDMRGNHLIELDINQFSSAQ